MICRRCGHYDWCHINSGKCQSFIFGKSKTETVMMYGDIPTIHTEIEILEDCKCQEMMITKKKK